MDSPAWRDRLQSRNERITLNRRRRSALLLCFNRFHLKTVLCFVVFCYFALRSRGRGQSLKRLLRRIQRKMESFRIDGFFPSKLTLLKIINNILVRDFVLRGIQNEEIDRV